MLLPDQQKENVHLSQEGQSRLCHCHRSIFRPSARSPPLSSLLLVFALICSRKFLLSHCLFPLISQVPTGTWKVGCAQRLERKLQQDNYGGQCPVDVISTSLLRPEVVFFFFSSIFLQVTLLLHPAQCLSTSVAKLSGIVWLVYVFPYFLIQNPQPQVVT